MILALLNFNEIRFDLEKEEFLEIVNAFIKKNNKEYKKFIQARKGVGA